MHQLSKISIYSQPATVTKLLIEIIDFPVKQEIDFLEANEITPKDLFATTLLDFSHQLQMHENYQSSELDSCPPLQIIK